MHNLTKALEKLDINIVFFWPVGVDWRPYKEKLLKQKNIDGVIVNGEGSIHHSATRPRAKYLAEIAEFYMQEVGAPCFLINSTICNNDEKTYRSLRKYKKIYVRESMSLNELENHDIRAEVSPDLSLYTPFKTFNKRENILVTDSVEKNISLVLKEFALEKDYMFYSMQSEKQQFLNRIKKKLKNILKIKQFYPARTKTKSVYPDNFLKMISSKKFIITGRFHTVAMCILTETPFLAVESNTPKISAMVKDVFGDANRVIKTKDLKAALTSANFAEFSKKEKENIATYKNNAIKKIDDMFSKINVEIRNP